MKELQKLGAPPSYEKLELLQRRKLYAECIKILLLMGASAGTKVDVQSRPASLVLRAFSSSWFPSSCYISCRQDLKSGRTSLHIASEEANVELLSIFLDQPSSPTFINTAVGCFVFFSPNTPFLKRNASNPTLPLCISDVQRQHCAARRLLSAEPWESGGGGKAAGETRSRSGDQEHRERASVPAGA